MAARLLVLLAFGLMSLGCAGAVAAEPAPVRIFAAASLSAAITEITANYDRSGRGRVTPVFAASSVLAKQIENGAPADIFVAASEQWMDYLAQRGMVERASRRDLVGNRLVLVAPIDSAIETTIETGFPLARLLGAGRLAVGDPDHVPAGIYAKAALERLGVWGAVVDRLARADNVRNALALVERGEVALGIVYATDARGSRKVRVVGVFPADSHPPIAYPVAIVAGRTAVAQRFADFLCSPEAVAVFRRYGFAPRP